MDAEIVIAGAGPAGCATALFLAAAAPARVRQRILLLDKAEFPRRKICAGAVGGRADRLLAAIGVRVEVAGAVVRGICVSTPAGRLSERLAEPIARVVDRAELDAALLEEVRRRGIAVRTGTAVTGLTTAPDSVLVHTSAGDLKSRVVVGADGVGSCVRRAIGAAPSRFHAQLCETHTAGRAGDLPPDVLHFDVSDRRLTGYAWDFPAAARGTWCRGVYQLARGVSAPMGQPLAVADHLRRRLARQGLSSDGLVLEHYSERGWSPGQPCSAPRVLLVGEAAGIDPVLGEGIAQAIGFGRAAAEYLVRRLPLGELQFTDYARALARTRLGRDLRWRAAAVNLIYGRTTRPGVERWLSSSRAIAITGMHYFAGRRVPRGQLIRALLDLALAWPG